MWHGGILILIHVTRSVHTTDLVPTFSVDFIMSALFWDGNASDDLTGSDNEYAGYEYTSDNVPWILFNSLDENAVTVKKNGGLIDQLVSKKRS